MLAPTATGGNVDLRLHFKGGFTPNVIFEGKVTVRAGPLQAEKGERPYFSQLYVHDSTLETRSRDLITGRSPPKEETQL